LLFILMVNVADPFPPAVNATEVGVKVALLTALSVVALRLTVPAKLLIEVRLTVNVTVEPAGALWLTGVTLRVKSGVGAGVAMDVEVGLGVLVAVAVALGVGVKVAGKGVLVRVAVRVGVKVKVGVAVDVLVGVLVAVRVAVLVGVLVLVAVGKPVGVAVAVGNGVGQHDRQATGVDTAPGMEDAPVKAIEPSTTPKRSVWL